MSTLGLVLREITRRKAGFVIACLAVAVAATGVVYTQTLSRAHVDALRRITVNMGSNILIVPAKADSSAMALGASGEVTMDDSLVAKIAASDVLAEHYVGKLQQRVDLTPGRAIILTGVMEELGSVGREKKQKAPLGYRVPVGKCFLGAAVAQRLGEKGKPGEKLTLMGREFEIAQVPGKEQGKDVMLDAVKPMEPVEDLRVFINIRDAQELFNLPGQIHAIDALGCICPLGESKPTFLKDIAASIEKQLPGTKAYTYRAKADARLKARQGTERASQLIVGALAVMAVLVIFFYLYSDVRERREELGMYLAVGFSPLRLAGMFLAKVLLVALIGAAIGYAAGSIGALYIDAEKFATVGIRPQMDWVSALLAAGGALVISALAAVIPVLAAASTDPADVLRKN